MRSSRWFSTWRTYGTWLPGADGFVGHYRAADGRPAIDHTYGLPATAALPALERHAHGLLKTAPVALTRPQAEAVLAQLHETARFRGRMIDAVAVLPRHVHLVFTSTGEPDPARTLADWKAYASRALNKLAGERRPWWAEGGSTQQLFDADAHARAIQYVRDQEGPLVAWLSADARSLVEPGT